MSKLQLIDQPLAAREVIFAARLKELMDETGIQIGIATIDAKSKVAVGAEVKPRIKTNARKTKPTKKKK